MNHPGKLILLAGLLAGAAGAQDRASAAGWLDNLTVTASGTANWVDNLSRTSFAPTRQNGETYLLDLGASRHQQLAPDWLSHGGVAATYFTAPDFDLTNYFKAGLQLGLQRKFGLGPLAPVLQLDTAFSYKAARLDADRGWTTEVGLRLSKRFTSSFKAGLNAQWLEHDARSGTFDLDQHSYSVDATWDLTEHWSFSGSAGRLHGNVVANAAWTVWAQAIGGSFGPTVANSYNSRPWQVTELYGPGWVSYNVEADIDLWSLAATYTLSEHTTAEIRYASAFVINQIGVRYPQETWGLSLVHRF